MQHGQQHVLQLCASLAVLVLQYLTGLAEWLPPQAGMFMWLKLGAGVKDADDIIDTLREEKVGVVPGECLRSLVLVNIIGLMG